MKKTAKIRPLDKMAKIDRPPPLYQKTKFDPTAKMTKFDPL